MLDQEGCPLFQRLAYGSMPNPAFAWLVLPAAKLAIQPGCANDTGLLFNGMVRK
jgi:hypothetical protein